MDEVKMPFDSKLFIDAWDEWIAYRKQKKIPKYVPIGLKKTFANLLHISGNNEQVAIAIINQSIEQNYQGLFPLKNTNKNVSTYQQPVSANRFQVGAEKLLAKGNSLYADLRGK